MIQTADNLRIRPEIHSMKPGDKYNPRHHDQHYHVETRRNPSDLRWQNKNVEIIKPQGYQDGTQSL
jgi:filamentous hemagglutinin